MKRCGFFWDLWGKILWIENHTFWPPKWQHGRGCALDIRITPSLWIVGRYNKLRHKYMMWRKKKKLIYNQPFWKAWI